MWVEVERYEDMGLKTGKKKFFQNFLNIVKIGYGSVIRQIARIKIWFLDKGCNQNSFEIVGKVSFLKGKSC
jgi:hypothetical protein